MSVQLNLVRIMEPVLIWLMITNAVVRKDLMEQIVQMVSGYSTFNLSLNLFIYCTRNIIIYKINDSMG